MVALRVGGGGESTRKSAAGQMDRAGSRLGCVHKVVGEEGAQSGLPRGHRQNPLTRALLNCPDLTYTNIPTDVASQLSFTP